MNNRGLRRAVVFAAFGLAVAVAPSQATAEELVIVCPDGYIPVPNILAPDIRDKNNNGFVCVKGPQGSNEHFNTKDDKGVDDII